MQEVKFEIGKGGKNIKIETSGFQGDTCEKEVNSIIESLDKDGIKGVKGDVKKKHEYYAQRAGASVGAR